MWHSPKCEKSAPLSGNLDGNPATYGRCMEQDLSDRDRKVVHEILLEQLEITNDQITPEARLVQDLGADSLDIAEISLTLEERFSLTIPDQEWEKVQTVQDLYE